MHCRGDIIQAIRATSFGRSGSCTWLGERLVAQVGDVAIDQANVVEALGLRLYASLYCHGAVEDPPQAPPAWGIVDHQRFGEDLKRANAGTVGWETDWKLDKQCDGHVILRGPTLAVHLDDLDLAAQVDGEPDAWLVRHPKGSFVAAPGYYLVVGDVPLARSELGTLVRLYFNLRLDRAVDWLALMTYELNAVGLPFQLKVLAKQDNYPRGDSAVVYIPRADFTRAAGVIARLWYAVRDHVREGTPTFTKRLLPGVALAEDPGDGTSFGMWICARLAEGLVAGNSLRRGDIDARLRSVVESFERAGIDVNAPYLRLGSKDVYKIRLQPASKVPSQRSTQSGGDHDGVSLRARLEMATAIALELVRTAIWDRDGCNWIGRISVGDDVRLNAGPRLFGPLGFDIYAGTAGLSLFLAEAAHATQRSALSDTALGAMRHALCAARLGPMNDPGLLTGLAGVALVGVRVGRLLGDENVTHDALGLSEVLRMCSTDDIESDMMSGLAGIIMALFTLHRATGHEWMQARALDLADELVSRANWSPQGASWRSSSGTGAQALIGFAHGVSGIAVALSEVAHQTGKATYAEVARAALQFEQNSFDAHVGNWPLYAPGGRGRRRPPAFVSHWCHGAPGIALGRMRAIDRDPPSESLAVANRALTVTATWCRQFVADGTGSLSLCHGLAGNADILLEGARGKRGTTDLRPAINHSVRRIGEQAAKASFSSNESAFPGLMLGLAGAGYFLLRTCDDKVPGILAIDPSRFLPEVGPRL
jgi:hypothetical protein